MTANVFEWNDTGFFTKSTALKDWNELGFDENSMDISSWYNIVKESGEIGYFMYGNSIMDIKELNSRLMNKGYHKFSDDFISIGAGGQKNFHKIIIGGEFHALRGTDYTHGIISLSSVYLFINLGYIIHSTSKLRVYPIVGLGNGSMYLRIAKGVTSTSFDDILNSPPNIVELNTDEFLINLAIETDYFLKLRGNNKKKNGLTFGFRAGYIFTPNDSNWNMEGIDISDGPKMGIEGPYFRFMIGYGGFRKE